MFTPSLTGAGERAHLLSRRVTLATHIDDIVNLILYEDLRDVVLVAHSYGGMVTTGVADRIPERLGRLVYLDAAYPRHGQTATGGFAEGTGEVLDAMSQEEAEGEAQGEATPDRDDDASWLLPPLPLAAYGVENPEDVAWIGERRTPHPLSTLSEPLFLTKGPTAVPRVYIRCSRREGLLQVFGADPLLPMFEQAKADGVELHTIDSGHDAMVTAAPAVAALVSRLAQRPDVSA